MAMTVESLIDYILRLAYSAMFDAYTLCVQALRSQGLGATVSVAGIGLIVSYIGWQSAREVGENAVRALVLIVLGVLLISVGCGSLLASVTDIIAGLTLG
jgi:hypothetical protein